MINAIKGNIKSDLLILYKNSIIQGAFMISILIGAFVLNDASKVFDICSEPGYYVSQLLITLSLFNVFFLIIIGAFLGKRDDDWNTYSIRLVNSRRSVVFISRIVLLILIAIVMLVFNILVGIIFDLSQNNLGNISVKNIYRDSSIILILCFWGGISFLLSSILKSFSLSSTICIACLLLESLVCRFIPDSIVKYLPVWNEKNLLKYFFEQSQGAVAVVQLSVRSYKWSLLIIGISTVVCVIILGVLCRWRNY